MAVKSWLKHRLLQSETIVHESGQLSVWLQHGFLKLGLSAICIDARRAHKSLSARLNKSEASDAEGLAQLARTGWFTPVFVRSLKADRLQALGGARERMIRLRKDLEGHIRLVLKTVSIRMTGATQRQLRQKFRGQLAAAGETGPVLRISAGAFIEMHAMPCKTAADLGKALKTKAETHPASKRLTTIPGVGRIMALSFIALIGDPNEFTKPSDEGAFPR
jgi:transposase